MESMTVRRFSGQIVGTIETDSCGNKTVRDFGGRILGYYRSSRDATVDFGGRIIAYGDVTGIFFKDMIDY